MEIPYSNRKYICTPYLGLFVEMPYVETTNMSGKISDVQPVEDSQEQPKQTAPNGAMPLHTLIRPTWDDGEPLILEAENWRHPPLCQATNKKVGEKTHSSLTPFFGFIKPE